MSANDSSERAANSGSSSTLSTTVSSRLIATIYSEVEHFDASRHAEAIPSTEEASVACTRMDDVTVFRGEHEAHYKCTAVAG